jgi:xylulokinase
MKYFLGIDIGTSGTKSLIMGAKGQVIATATAGHGISAPKPLWSEQDPADWWRSSVKATQAVIKKSGIDGGQIAAIGLSGQMHGLVITDEGGKPLRPSIIWNDQRTARQAAGIEEAVGGRAKLIELVGNPAMTSFTLTKLLWVRDNEPRIYARIRHMLLPKDYIRLCLTGEYAGEVADMSGTLMLDQRKRDWSDAIISRFQIDRAILPPVVESHEITGMVTPRAAKLLGISAGTPVVGGGGDQQAGAVGNGVVEEGLTSATMGTSGVVFVHSHKYKTDPQGRINTFCSSVAGEYCMFGCMLSTGGSLQWYRNVLGQAEVAAAAKKGVEPYDLIVAQAQQAPAGCEGVYWLPYLTGERTPHADPLARACWIGIHSRTTRAELARSIMEGATYAMNDAVTLLGDSGQAIKQVRLSGGGARSRFWRQLQADIYGKTCVTINAEEGPAYGAAILASVGAGHFKSVREACKAGIKVTRTIKPNAAAKRFYQAHYKQFRRLYPAIKAEFARIAELG